MGYATLVLGVIMMAVSIMIYRKADPREDLYTHGLLIYVLSWLVFTFGAWQVIR